jgi:hypothetical protein
VSQRHINMGSIELYKVSKNLLVVISYQFIQFNV